MKNHLKKIVRYENEWEKNNFAFNLDQNERNYNFQKEFFNKFLSSISENDIRFYPNTKLLKKKLGEYHNISSKKIMLTPGSDIAIKTFYELFDLKGYNIITSDYCFPMYKVYADLYQADIRYAIYKNLKLNITSIIEKIDNNTKFIILANPNSPLGDSFTVKEIELLLKTKLPVFIDEAYIELSNKKSCVKLVKKYKNLFIAKTFSKGFGAAGLRCGYIITSEKNIQLLSKFRFMYEVNSFAVTFCTHILNNISLFQKYFSETLTYKNKLVKELEKDFSIFNTDSSWFFIERTNKLEKIFKKNKVKLKTLKLPLNEKTFYKFNYDLSIRGSKFENQLLNEN